MTARAEASTRRSRDDWLARGLESLREEGIPGLRTERLAGALGVTTGSFYWHFENRADFDRQLLSHWERHLTLGLLEEAAASAGSPLERLHTIFARIHDDGLARYETPVRAWALTEPVARAAVAKVDALRIESVTRLLRELGLGDDDVEMRARTLLFCAMAEPAFFVTDADADRARWMRMRVDLLAALDPRPH